MKYIYLMFYVIIFTACGDYNYPQCDNVVTCTSYATNEQVFKCEPCDGDPTQPFTLQDMEGNWSGELTLSNQNMGSRSWNAIVEVTPSLNSTQVIISGVCPNGDGIMAVMPRSFNMGSWSGQYSCTSAAFDGCESVTFTYEIISISLGGDDLLHLNGTGRASGCGRSRIFYSVSMVGSKQ